MLWLMHFLEDIYKQNNLGLKFLDFTIYVNCIAKISSLLPFILLVSISLKAAFISPIDTFSKKAAYTFHLVLTANFSSLRCMRGD